LSKLNFTVLRKQREASLQDN